MNDEEINRVIAEQLGWTDIRVSALWEDHQVLCGLNPRGNTRAVPNYCRDLNAMHEAEKVLLADADTGYEYDMELNGVCECWEDGIMNYMKLWHSTARQRAEAFLRTVGKWKENE